MIGFELFKGIWFELKTSSDLIWKGFDLRFFKSDFKDLIWGDFFKNWSDLILDLKSNFSDLNTSLEIRLGKSGFFKWPIKLGCKINATILRPDKSGCNNQCYPVETLVNIIALGPDKSGCSNQCCIIRQFLCSKTGNWTWKSGCNKWSIVLNGVVTVIRLTLVNIITLWPVKSGFMQWKVKLDLEKWL